MNDPRDLVRKQFGEHARNYVESYDHAKGESLDRLLVLADPRPEWRALDVATGGGHTALALSPRVREVVATDLTPRMLEEAETFLRSRGAANVGFQVADAGALPFADQEFDLVTCRIAPHHFPDCAAFVRETFRVLRPGGTAVVIDNVVPEDETGAAFVNDFERVRDPSHHWAYREADWRRFFEAAGFEGLVVEGFRKRRDFEYWTGMMSVTEPVKARLRAMVEEAPPSAREALAPDLREGKLGFYLSEILILGRRPSSHPRSR